MNGLRGIKKILELAELNVDIAIKQLAYLAAAGKEVSVLSVAIARNDTSVHTLEQTGQLPRSRATLRVTDETLLGHDGDGVSWRTAEGREDVVPDVGLVLLL